MLDLSGCVQLTNDGLAALGLMAALRRLSLYAISAVSDMFLALTEKMVGLVELDLTGCCGVTVRRPPGRR